MHLKVEKKNPSRKPFGQNLSANVFSKTPKKIFDSRSRLKNRPDLVLAPLQA